MSRAFIVGSVMFSSLYVIGVGAGAREDALLEAAKRGDGVAVRALVRQHVDVNASEQDGMTPLHWVVLANDLQSVALLVGAGANANVSSRYGITPLSLAATNGNAAII